VEAALSTATNPDLRAQIIAGIIQHIAATPAVSTYDAVFRRALDASGMPEEEVGSEIRNATSCLIFSGVVLSNGLARDPLEIYYSAKMELVPGPWLLRFVWGDRPESAESCEGGDA